MFITNNVGSIVASSDSGCNVAVQVIISSLVGSSSAGSECVAHGTTITMTKEAPSWPTTRTGNRNGETAIGWTTRKTTLGYRPQKRLRVDWFLDATAARGMEARYIGP